MSATDSDALEGQPREEAGAVTLTRATNWLIAVYLGHHYVVDVVGGVVYGTAG
jgi:hypothetical protein